MEKGYASTSIRNIAEKIEYSPATVYLYYRDKDEIMHALHQEGFKMLLTYFAPAIEIADPFERLKRMGYEYIRFAMENPDMYNLIFVMEDPIDHVDRCSDVGWKEGNDAFGTLLKTVNDCQQQGYFASFEPQGLSFMIWSTMHGLCTLRGSGHLGHVEIGSALQPDIDALMKYTFETFLAVLKQLK